MEIISRDEAREQGLTQFYTGQPCKHGHNSKRYVANTQCVECAKKHNQRNGSAYVGRPSAPKDEAIASWRRSLIARAMESSENAKLDGWSKFPIDEDLVHFVQQTARLWKQLEAYVEMCYGRKR